MPSLLPELSPLAGIILAFNVAYLRLDQFRHQERVKDYAQAKLDDILDSRSVPDTAHRSENYSSLINLAESPKGRVRDLKSFGALPTRSASEPDLIGVFRTFWPV